MTYFNTLVEHGRVCCRHCGHTPSMAELTAGALVDPESDDAWCAECHMHDFGIIGSGRAKCRNYGSTNLDKDDDCLTCGESIESYDDDEPCDNCNGRGYLFPWRDDTGFACVESCGDCDKFTYDDEAATELATLLLKRNGDYCMGYILLPEHTWDDPGAVANIVMRLDAPSMSYRPLTFKEGLALAEELWPSATSPRCCPRCNATDLVVQLPAAFCWNGKDYAVGDEDLAATEFPISDTAMVLCNSCDWTGDIGEMTVLAKTVSVL